MKVTVTFSEMDEEETLQIIAISPLMVDAGLSEYARYDPEAETMELGGVVDGSDFMGVLLNLIPKTLNFIPEVANP